MSESVSSVSSSSSVVDGSSDFGARAAQHLTNDPVVWFTTVSPSGAPSPNVVWFVWDGADTVRLFSLPSAARVKHLETHPKVTLSFAGDGQGGDIVVLAGTAVVGGDAPAADAVPEYLAKYAERIPQINHTPESFAAAYSVPITVTLTALRGH